MPTVIHGLPAHVLLIHVVVVLIPLGALFTVLSAVWPVARRKLGFISPATCLTALILVPITTNAGRWYQHYLEDQARQALPAIDHHGTLGKSLIWFALALFTASAAVYAVGRYGDQTQSADGRARLGHLRALSFAVAAASLIVSLLTVWWLYRVGDSGARAVYGGTIHS